MNTLISSHLCRDLSDRKEQELQPELSFCEAVFEDIGKPSWPTSGLAANWVSHVSAQYGRALLHCLNSLLSSNLTTSATRWRNRRFAYWTECIFSYNPTHNTPCVPMVYLSSSKEDKTSKIRFPNTKLCFRKKGKILLWFQQSPL